MKASCSQSEDFHRGPVNQAALFRDIDSQRNGLAVGRQDTCVWEPVGTPSSVCRTELLGSLPTAELNSCSVLGYDLGPFTQ